MIEFSVPDFNKKGSIYYPPLEKVSFQTKISRIS